MWPIKIILHVYGHLGISSNIVAKLDLFLSYSQNTRLLTNLISIDMHYDYIKSI